MRGLRGRELLALPVRVHGIQIGRPVDVLVDLASDRILGLDVRCGDGVHRFAPISAVSIRDDELALSSTLTLLEEAELAFYRDRAASLSLLRGLELLQGGRPVGRLADIVVGDGGVVEAVVLDDGTVLPGGHLQLAPPSAA